MKSDIANINEILARDIASMSSATSIGGSTMHDTLIDPYGWRELGLFLSGGHGKQSYDVAIVGRGGNQVAP